MSPSQFPTKAFRRLGLLFLILIAGAIGLWLAVRDGKKAELPGHVAPAGSAPAILKSGNRQGGSAARVEEVVSDSHPSPQSSAGTSPSPQSSAGASRQPLQVLASGKEPVDERVRQLQGMRGMSFSKEQREFALSFLTGTEVLEGMSKGSIQWLADELLTVIRLQEPPWDGLAEDLAKAAFQADTDPVVRDYIMQHLGHLWEQSGSSKEIDNALWQAVASSDETTPGTALIALSRGYERDQQEQSLAKVRQQALELARNPDTTLAVRVTALSIAGDGNGKEVKELAEKLIAAVETPVVLKKVAEAVLR